MKAHVVKIYILLPADIHEDSEVEQAMQHIMSEKLMFDGHILDWEFVDVEERVIEIGEEWDPSANSISISLEEDCQAKAGGTP